jgi:hypothetical protein
MARAERSIASVVSNPDYRSDLKVKLSSHAFTQNTRYRLGKYAKVVNGERDHCDPGHRPTISLGAIVSQGRFN